MKYLKLYEEMFVSKTLEKYANIIMHKINESDKSKDIYIKITPEHDFSINSIRIIFTDSYCSFNSELSDNENITLEINPNRLKFSVLVHELTHAFQFTKINSKGHKMNGFLGQFVAATKDLSKDTNYQFLLMGLYFSIPTETAAHIAEFNYTDSKKIENWIKWYKNFNLDDVYRSFISIEDIEDFYPDYFVEMYKQYCQEGNFPPNRGILKLENKSLLDFLRWSKKLFDKFAKKLEQKILKIKSTKTIS